MTDAPSSSPHPPRVARKPVRRRKAHARHARPKAKKVHLVRHGLLAAPEPAPHK